MEPTEFILELITDVRDKMLERLWEAYITQVITSMTTSLTSTSTTTTIVIVIVVQNSGHLHVNCGIQGSLGKMTSPAPSPSSIILLGAADRPAKAGN